MATHPVKALESIRELLLHEARLFDFFQAVRLLELSQPHCAPVGEGCEPEKEPVRFSADVSFGFPSTDVQELFIPQNGPSDGVPFMVTNFLGLAGAAGPLPTPITELVLEKLRENDPALRDFLDIFNHRLI